MDDSGKKGPETPRKAGAKSARGSAWGIRPSAERRNGAVSLDQVGMKLMRPLLGKRGLGEGDIAFHWESIVGGSFMARNSAPERIVFPKGSRTGGILHLRVPNGALAMELQHLKPLVMQRVNSFYGYPAIADVRIHQRPLPPRPVRPGDPPPLAEEERKTLDTKLKDIETPRLKAALAGLGEAMTRRGKGSKRD
jgi:hypothetical protein